MSGLPPNWAECTFDEVTIPVEMTGRTDPDRDIWYIDISSIDNQTNRITEPKRLCLSEAPSRARQKIQTGDVLFSTVRPYLRKIAAVSDQYDGEIASTGFAVLRPAKGVDPGFLFYKSLSRDFVSALTGEQYGVSYPAVKDEQVRAQPFPLAPPNEQRRIVAKIEELFTELDNGIESLKRAREQLKLYRQSVLKHAFEGKLTADWRKANKDKLKDPEALLAHMNKGQKKKRGNSGMSGLPESWAMVEITKVLALNENGKPFQQGWSPQCESQPAPKGDWGVLKTTAIQPGEFWPHENKRLPNHLEERPHIEVRPNDILMTCAGPRNRCGIACLVEQTPTRLMMSGKMYRFRTEPEAMEPKYLAYYLMSRDAEIQIDKMKTGINDSGLNLTHNRFATFTLSVPSPSEQRQIVAEIEQAFSKADYLEGVIDNELARVEVLRQSVLKQAFSGQLVPQDPADEPASALLGRIRQINSKPDKTKRKKKVMV